MIGRQQIEAGPEHLHFSSANFRIGGEFRPRIAQAAFKLPEIDSTVHKMILGMRDQTERIDRYRSVKKAAEKEVQDIPGDIVSRLLKRGALLIDELPTGHSKGHLSRDLIHLTEVFQDPLTPQYDDVEVMVGILAGTFHDIGNSLIGRTEERDRLVYHAEAGAWYAGEEFKGDELLPPNTLLLTQLAIAAHTKFQIPADVYRNGRYVGTRNPYETKVEIDDEGHHDKRSLALTRTSCRGDIISPILVVRHLPLAMNVENLVLATGELRSSSGMSSEGNLQDLFQLNSQEPGAMLKYFQTIASNARNPHSWHNEDDTPHITDQLFSPNADDLEMFVTTVLAPPPADINIQAEADRFFSLCYLLDPGFDARIVIEKARSGFHLSLPSAVQEHWAAGFKMLSEVLYPRYFQRMTDNANTLPSFVGDRPANIKAVVEDVHFRAGKVLAAINPDHLGKPVSYFPDITEALSA